MLSSRSSSIGKPPEAPSSEMAEPRSTGSTRNGANHGQGDTSAADNRAALRFFPIADTFSGAMARAHPENTIAHYERLASRLWISPQVRDVAQGVLDGVGQGRVAWCSAVAPYGFGKTATSITLWAHARAEGFWAIPPLSCTNFDELAHGIAALLQQMHPKHSKAIGDLFDSVWSENVRRMTERDAGRYGVDARTMRRILQDKLQAGELAVDSRPHRLVEFLSRLGEMAAKEGRGLVIVLDELQQLLGTLDARAIIAFREFVWGIRTEHAPCAVFLSMDTLLEARLARWAADLLHRIREHGPVLALGDVYRADFPHWLWNQATSSSSGVPSDLPADAVSEDVLCSLGQFVERPDLASGPRTVVDTFARAAAHWSQTQTPYDLEQFVTDLSSGRLRYFGEGAPVQRVLRDLTSDEWVAQDAARCRFVRLLAAFPSGCPASVLQRHFPDGEERIKLRTELFGPLMVSLPDGLALEALQRVRRSSASWESVVERCWEQLPALDVMASHMPDIVRRVLVPRLLPASAWRLEQTDALFSLRSDGEGVASGEWTRWRGSFSPDYPNREVALWIGQEAPSAWPGDCDIALALLCIGEEDAEPSLSLDAEHGRLTLRLPVLRPLQDAPPELQRFAKHIEPEPLRPATVLLAVHDLHALLELDEKTPEKEAAPSGAKSSGEDKDEFQGLAHARNFVETTCDFLLSQIVAGRLTPFRPLKTTKTTKSAPLRSLQMNGLNAVRGAFVAACRARYRDYETLQTTPRWSEGVRQLQDALASSSLSARQRRGQEAVSGSKSSLVPQLFGYNSTAAFDSYQRALGAILKTEGDAEHWNLTFALHPAETALLDYAREAGRTGLTDEAAREYLRHRGYLEEETAHIIRLLEARGFLSRRGDGRLAPVASDSVRREGLEREIAVLEDALTPWTELLSRPTLPEEPLARRDALQGLLESAVLGCQTQAKVLQEELLALIGELRAQVPPQDFPESTYRTHLSGISRTLDKTHLTLMNEGRRLRAQVEEQLDGCGLLDKTPSSADVIWAKNWREVSPTWREEIQRLKSRTEDYTARYKDLMAWLDASVREVALHTRASQMTTSQPQFLQRLEELNGEFTELFALSGMAPLSQINRFHAGLDEIESELQGSLWGQMEVYLREAATLRARWGRFLPLKDEPLGVPAEGEEPHAWLQKSFGDLHRWALGGFTATWERYRRVQSGARWRHPTNERKKWEDWSHEMGVALERAQNYGTPQTLHDVGERLQATVQGFSFAAWGESLLGPHERDELDFDRLQLLHQQGRVRIIVESLETEGGDGSA